MVTGFPRLSFGILVVLSFLAVMPARAVELAEAEALVRAAVTEASESLSGGPYSAVEKRRKIAGLVSRYSDISFQSEQLLGRHWRKASPEQQRAFTDLLVPFVVATYGAMIEGAEVKPDVVFRGAEPAGAGVFVHTRLVTPGDEPVDVEWLIQSMPSGRLGVADLVADNISMVTTMRADFTAVVRSGGGNLDALLLAMRKKIEAAE